MYFDSQHIQFHSLAIKEENIRGKRKCFCLFVDLIYCIKGNELTNEV